jgi:RsiW-degrading membrane proteinase PrsW (M82 family)
MSPALFVFPVLVPAVFWAAYHYYHDRRRPEPLWNLMLAALLGAGASWISKFLYLSLDRVGLRYDALELAQDNLPGLFLFAVLGIGLIEETAKMLPFLLVVLRFRDFDEPLDGIVYGSFIALGYALVENVHYLQFLSPAEAAARGFAGPLVHIVFASVWAYRVGLAHLAGRSVARAALGWLAVTALLHGTYDFVVLGFPTPALIGAAGLIVAMWVWRLVVIRRLGASGPAG